MRRKVKDAYQVLVIGGGHAGVEAAVAAAVIGCSTVLITPSITRISLMSCNPAIGGIAKGTLVREIDGLGGVAAESADHTALQFRMLNMKKGPAVWGPRVQSDVEEYCLTQREKLRTAGVHIIQGMVVKLVGPNSRIEGVLLSNGRVINAEAFVLATGTFLNGMLHRGKDTWPGGRRGDNSAIALEKDLKQRMFHVKRFKTGTSPRVVRNSIDNSLLEKQVSHDVKFRFSWSTKSGIENRETCWLTRTTGETERIVKENLRQSPLYSGRISGKGPRYCPSFEDKVTKFPDRKGHPIHLEPMGKSSRIMYLNGLSTSLPQAIQEKIVRSLPGFKNAVITAYGYSVEYSCFETGEFDGALKLRDSENLYVSGQILGTSGYEEAAATGLLAGASAARKTLGMRRVVPERISSYLGVMVNDLVTKGTEEPYRLFSSRSENRLNLRQDNADRRVYSLGCALGTLSDEKKKAYGKRERKYIFLRKEISGRRLQGKSVEEICRRPEVSPDDIAGIIGFSPQDINEKEILNSVVLDIKYAGYVKRAEKRHRIRKRYGMVSLSVIDDYDAVQTITIEAREALNRRRPETLSDAEAIPAVRQADMDALVLHLMSGSVSRET
ncbi:MAG: tRNA uridine-5-carboxymethylaminomethyl(34) synthesis enzyme MnmG [Candidatus Sabulitectum sp.]|nr:tRNA uridine-5-carboxymethylaminomethyl(34) synthesis enzyme MnmG [Candidatus Sabulitectum sp.]